MLNGWLVKMSKLVVGNSSIPRRYNKGRGAGIENIAKDLSEHFFNNPEAGDTVEGIADWWVARQRRSNAISLIQKALEFLIDEGVVRKRSYGNREIYSATKN